MRIAKNVEDFFDESEFEENMNQLNLCIINDPLETRDLKKTPKITTENVAKKFA